MNLHDHLSQKLGMQATYTELHKSQLDVTTLSSYLPPVIALVLSYDAVDFMLSEGLVIDRLLKL